eukprot:1385684-Heterocapsa_arctica.AAC.1
MIERRRALSPREAMEETAHLIQQDAKFYDIDSWAPELPGATDARRDLNASAILAGAASNETAQPSAEQAR